MYGDQISPGEREIVERYLRKLEEDLSKRLEFNVRLSTTSLTRGSLIQFGPFQGDPSGILNRLLKIAGITAAVGAGWLNFEQAIVKYPEARDKFPILLEDIREAFAEIMRDVASKQKLKTKKGEIHLLEAEAIESQTASALNSLLKNLKPGEGEVISSG